MSEWSVETTDDIREVDEAKKPAANAAFNKKTKRRDGKHVAGEEKGAEGEYEEQPDRDKEAAP